jgi:hypothetical protein
MSFFGRALIAATPFMTLACGGSDSDGAGGSGGQSPTGFDYPRDGSLRLNQLQAKGTHNSYHIEPEGNTIAPWDYTHLPLDEQLRSQGVRKVELDTYINEAEQAFEVYHFPTIDAVTTCLKFVDCLARVKLFSDENPAHHPVFIQIEPKTPVPAAAEEHFALLEAEISSVWPRERIVTPDDVRKDSATLRDAVLEHGWPTLGEVRGKVLFFVNESGPFRTAYTRGDQNLDGRLMFVESSLEHPYAAILILNDPGPDVEAAVRGGYIVRTRADSDSVEPIAGDTSRRDLAFASGAQLVSTDYPAPVAGVDYVVEVPDGTPSRCNPLSAPAECSSTDIENPEFIEP